MILIVEDDAAIAEAATETLEDEGYPVTRVPNGLEALKVLQAGLRPCLVLLDMMMPIMDGWEFLKNVQADSSLSSIPIVLTTAVARPPVQSVKGILRKPYDLDDLADAAQRFCSPTAS